MKRIIGLLLVLTMLFGMVGVTTTAAAESADVPVLGAFTMDDDGVITLEVTGFKPENVEVYFKTSEGNYAGRSVTLTLDSETGKYTGERGSYYVEQYPDAVVSSFSAYSNENDLKADDKTQKSTNIDTYFYYSKDKELVSSSETEIVRENEKHSWMYDGQERTDYATTSVKQIESRVSYENGKETGTTVTTTNYDVKLAKDPEATWLSSFYFYNYDYEGNYTIQSASQEVVKKGIQVSESYDGKTTTTTTSDLKTTYKLSEEKRTDSDGDVYYYRDFKEDAKIGTETVNQKGTEEYDWSSQKTVRDETTETTYAADGSRTVARKKDNKVYNKETNELIRGEKEDTKTEQEYTTAKYTYKDSEGKEQEQEITGYAVTAYSGSKTTENYSDNKLTLTTVSQYDIPTLTLKENVSWIPSDYNSSYYTAEAGTETVTQKGTEEYDWSSQKTVRDETTETTYAADGSRTVARKTDNKYYDKETNELKSALKEDTTTKQKYTTAKYTYTNSDGEEQEREISGYAVTAYSGTSTTEEYQDNKLTATTTNRYDMPTVTLRDNVSSIPSDYPGYDSYYSSDGTYTTTDKRTEENYTSRWDDEAGESVRVLFSTEDVDEATTYTISGNDRTTVASVNNKTTYASDGRVTENQSETTSTAEFVERESYYGTNGKEKAWQTTGVKSENKTTNYRGDGTKSSVVTKKEEKTQKTIKNSYSGSDYFNWATRDETSKTQEIRENYDSKGAYSGKTVTRSENENDVEANVTLKSSGTSKDYNKDDVLTSESKTDYTNTLNTAKDARRYDYTYSSASYSNKGLKTSSSTTSKLNEYKREKDEDGNWSGWQTSTEKSETRSYDREDKLTGVSESDAVYNKDGSYTSTSTNKSYNSYTGAMTSENTTVTKRDADYNYTYDRSYTYNNDDGSLRRKYVQNADGSRTYYNNAGAVVATRDKSDMDGTWKRADGTVIGKNNLNDSEDGTGEETYVYFRGRDGEISSINITKVEKADGVKTETNSRYNGNNKLTGQTVTVTQEDGSYTRTENGVLRYSYDAEKHEEKYYDFQGNPSWSNTYDPETGEQNEYNYKGTLVSKYLQTGDGSGTRWYYDEDGAVTAREEYGDYSTAYYDGNDNLRWSEETVREGDRSSRVYKDKNGNEFARTFYTHEDTSTDGVNSYTATSQEFYENEDRDLETATVSLEKRVTDHAYYTEDGVTTDKYTYNYTKWRVENGVKGAEVTRKEESVSTEDDNKYERTSTTDGIMTYHSVSEKDDYGSTVKTTTSYYDSYTGLPTSTDKKIYTGVLDSPISYSKYYDKYGNLQTYTVTDDTDDWDWSHTYYADGTLKQESWNDGLDDRSSETKSYSLSGDLTSVSTRDGDTSRTIRYNKDGSYKSWADKVDGVTNEWLYDSQGNLTGKKWNQRTNYEDYDEYGGGENGSSYEYLDANDNLIFRYEEAQLASGWTESYSDDAGNKLAYTEDTGWTLTVASGVTDGWVNLFGNWFYLENGEPVRGGWRLIGSAWYYFGWNGMMTTGFIGSDYGEYGPEKVYAMDKDGQLATGGWTQLDEAGTRWAYTDADGKVITGWQQINGKWYYFTEGWSYNKADYKEDAYWYQSSSRGQMATGAVQIWNDDWKTKHTFFFNEDGTWDTAPGWKVAQISGNVEYHYYDANGKEAKGWQLIDGNWYYFNDDGVLRNGWVNDGPNWYFMDPAEKGAMATGGWVEDKFEDYYYVNADGTMVTGWLEDGGIWYYLKNDGAMAAGEFVGSGSDWYYMDKDGLMVTGWKKINNNWYCFADSGLMATGWLEDGGTWFYMNSNGAMAHDEWVGDGSDWYYMDEDGLMETGWKEIDGSWYYLGDDGLMATGWKEVDGARYYFNSNGTLATGWLQDGGSWYYLGEDGPMATGWKKVDNTWYYFNENGTMKTGWLQDGASWYYLTSRGTITKGWAEIDGQWEMFDDNGIWQYTWQGE